MRPVRLGSMVLVAGLAVAGCGGRAPTIHYYVLEPPNDPRAPTAEGLTIGVPAVHVAAPYDQDRIVYRVGEVEVGFYTYHRWAAPLERMLPALVAEACRGLNGVHQIEPAVANREYDAYLQGRVTALEEIDTPEGVRVLARLDLRLVRDGVTVWSETVEHESAIDGNDVQDVVRGMAKSIDEAVRAALPAMDTVLTSLNRSGER